jgi:hypothetical protein
LPDSLPSIGNYAFQYCTSLTNIIIPGSVTNIGAGLFGWCTGLNSATFPENITSIAGYMFEYCTNLTGVFFYGNAPTNNVDLTVFIGDTNATVYYLPGTTNWGSTLDGRPTVLWNPQAQTGDGSFGVQTNQFGFNITGSSNLVIVVEAATNLANPVWSPVSTNTLNTFVGTNGTSYFSDPQWTNYPTRYYRLRSP